MINLSHNKNLNFAFLFSYFLIYNLHATTSTLLPEQSPKYPQFTAPLVSKHSDLPQFLQLTHAPCIRHFFSIFFFFFLFCNFQKIQCIFSFWIKHSFFVFFGFVWCFFSLLFLFFLLNPNMQNFFQKRQIFARETGCGIWLA